MLLSHQTSVNLDKEEANILGHLCYAAYKLWNICNDERYHYKEQHLEQQNNRMNEIFYSFITKTMHIVQSIFIKIFVKMVSIM